MKAGVEGVQTEGAPEIRGSQARYKDLREWIAAMDKMGELRRIAGAHWDLEIGALSEIARLESKRKPALLFDQIPGYPKGYRVLSNPMKCLPQVAYTLNIPGGGKTLDTVRALREKLQQLRFLPPRTVKSGPVMENVCRDGEIDLLKFPVPKWHELDGGRYIGTGCVVITRDPETGWVNLGTYRVMIHSKDSLGISISPGKDARIQMEKAFRAGKPFEVAISFGHDPLLFVAASAKFRWGVSEYDWAGAMKGEPIEVIQGPVTGLPIPARSELAIEGVMTREDAKVEGPFGEFTGYYASGSRPQPVIRVKSLMHRNDPILLGAPPGRPPSTLHMYFIHSATLWDAIESAGVPDVCGVWQHPMAPNWMFTAVAIQQRYPGHARQAGLVASQAQGGAYMGRYVIVVDEDIDPSNLEDVIWALTTRSDPEKDIEIVRRCWSGPLDPIIPEGSKGFNSRAIIDACRPYEWRDQFPPVVEVKPELRERVLKKWAREILE